MSAERPPDTGFGSSNTSVIQVRERIANFLKEARLQAKIQESQVELALERFPAARIRAIENSEEEPSLAEFLALLQFYGTSLEIAREFLIDLRYVRSNEI